MKSTAKVPDCQECPVRHRSVFKDLEQHLLSEMSSSKYCNIYRKGDTIFHENNHPMGLYAIFSGKVKVYKTNDTGKEQIIRLAKEGDALGYRSLISGEAYMASAAALEDTRICFIPKSMFFNVMQNSSNLFTRIIQLLSHDLKSAENKISALAQKTVRERVAECILIIKEYYGTETDGETLKATLSREDMANLVGTATESLIRNLSELKSEKVIELKDKKIRVLDLKKLEKIANIID